MFKKVTKYNYKTIAPKVLLALLGTGLFASCSNDEPTPSNVDTNAKEIAALEQDSIAQADVVRSAIASAKTSPNDITNAFNTRMAMASQELGVEPKNLEDTTVVGKKAAQIIKDMGTGINEDALTSFQNECETYQAFAAELAELRSQNQK